MNSKFLGLGNKSSLPTCMCMLSGGIPQFSPQQSLFSTASGKAVQQSSHAAMVKAHAILGTVTPSPSSKSGLDTVSNSSSLFSTASGKSVSLASAEAIIQAKKLLGERNSFAPFLGSNSSVMSQVEGTVTSTGIVICKHFLLAYLHKPNRNDTLAGCTTATS
jgi:hypothetical protein